MRAVQVKSFRVRSTADIPNSKLPVLIYARVLPRFSRNKANTFKNLFYAKGWRGLWRQDTIYTFRHFHSNAHEVLGIARGSVTLEIGGSQGRIMELKAGDVLILPAGIGHRRLQGSRNLSVIGAYPPGQQKYNLCRDVTNCRDALRRIAATALPKIDPVYTSAGPLLKKWKAS